MVDLVVLPLAEAAVAEGRRYAVLAARLAQQA
jgi:hypothetical protein